MGSHSVTCHPTQVNASRHAGRYSITYPGGIEGWVDLGVGYIPRWFTRPQTVTHPSSNHSIATWPGVEPTTSRSQVQRPERYTTKPPNSSSSSSSSSSSNTDRHSILLARPLTWLYGKLVGLLGDVVINCWTLTNWNDVKLIVFV